MGEMVGDPIVQGEEKQMKKSMTAAIASSIASAAQSQLPGASASWPT